MGRLELNCKCKICNKLFHVYPSYKKRGDGIYCSVQCKRKGHSIFMYSLQPENRPHWKGGKIDKNCTNCGKLFKINRNKINQNKIFCSKSCSNSYNVKLRQKTGKIITCLLCGKSKYLNLFAINKGEGLYCSMKCRAINNVRNQKKSGTDIEIILESWLKQNKIVFEKQHPICGIALADFFIKPNIIIFCDGDYWHSLPNRIIKDKEQTEILSNSGYIVYRLKGSEIKNGIRPFEILN